ncbi:hypothetical protein [Variovorax rhizosphaerae]|uniref:TniQ protein n=1 Tax=Variovorax rhizosphaerae TaxID=1836200 RepID=A0ABU8WTU0_9BURK
MTAEAMGLTWYPTWLSDGEGPYTRMAKLAAANPLPPVTLRRLLLNEHSSSKYSQVTQPNSFLSNGWMRRGAKRCAWSNSLANSALSATLGDWTTRLAGDRHVRYCPACLEMGFHSSVCQMDALLICPLHGQAMQSTCVHCGAGAPAFAWDDCTPMACTHCLMPLSAAWSPSGALRWKLMPGAQQYSTLEKRLEPLRHANWTDPDGWACRYSGKDAINAKRRAEGALLVHVLGIPATDDIGGMWPSTPEVMILPLGQLASARVSEDMCRIYEGFCESIAPSLGRAEAEKSVQCFLSVRDRAFRVGDFRDERSFAYILFRRRFEVTDRPNGQHLATQFLSESMKGLLPTFSTDLEAWRRFLDLCYRAELRYCEFLHDRTHGLVPGEPAWKEVVSMHSAALSPLMLPLPYGMGILKVTRGQDTFAVIALAELS